MASKIVGIESSKKPDACLYCGHEPAHPNMTCPRVARFELWEDGTLAGVEFFEPEIWQPRAPRDK